MPPVEIAKDAPAVLVAGASSNPDRFSNKAVKSLLDAGWRVLPLNPAGGSLYGVAVLKSLSEIPQGVAVHTLTLYVNAKLSSAMAEELLALKPKRAIFNPGAENPELMARFAAAGAETLEACTLVMLRAGQF